MKIALDAMGGDYAPTEIIKGALLALAEFEDISISLVGSTRAVERLLKKLDKKQKYSQRLAIVEAPDNVTMSEHPVEAVRKKKNCSINVGHRLVKEGSADAFVSAGNTGAVMASAFFTLGRIKRVERPALVNAFPTKSGGKTVILDLGANSDCKPSNLVQFAKMGSAYAQSVLGIKNPKVGLLNIGEEDEKGSDFTTTTNKLMWKEKELNFYGNVEGKDIFNDIVDVVVTDGFTGNVVLKFAEGMASFVKNLIKNGVKKNPLAFIGAIFMFMGMKKSFKKIDYREYGGAPLLGVNGVSFITHGRSKAKAIRGAIMATREAVAHDLVGTISQKFV